MERLPGASLTHLTSATSDHVPLLLEFGTGQEDHKKHTFKYELMSETHVGLKDMILAGMGPRGSMCHGCGDAHQASVEGPRQVE